MIQDDIQNKIQNSGFQMGILSKKDFEGDNKGYFNGFSRES